MPAVATTPLSKEELARRWNEIVKEFERVNVEGWTIETNHRADRWVSEAVSQEQNPNELRIRLQDQPVLPTFPSCRRKQN